MMNNKIIKTLRALIFAIIIFVTFYAPDLRFEGIGRVLDDFNRNCRQRGLAHGIKWMKDVRLAFTKYMAGDSKPNVRVKLAKNGCPDIIWSNCQDVLSHPKGMGIMLTILSISRPFEGIFKPDLSDIIGPSRANEEIFDKLEMYIPGFIKEVCRIDDRKNKIKIPRWSSWLNNTKIAPNGVSINTSYSDISLVTSKMKDDLFVLGGESFKKEYNFLEEIWNDPVRKKDIIEAYPIVDAQKSKYLGRLAVIPSPEGKSRVIAIGDYWSQNVLYPLHKKIFGILRRIPGDLTFDQGSGLTRIKKNAGHSFWSLDLKSATDRFPIAIQKKIISHLFGEEYAVSWSNLMTRPFAQSIDRTISEVSYSVGQPIGMYSSWAAFTLSHHFVLYCASKITNNPIKGNYVILGDDIVISNDSLAIEYKSLIASLGVEISEHKTHRSEHSFEIAKRWITKNGEQSPFPIVPLIQSRSWVAAISATVMEAIEKDWNPSIPIPEFIAKIAISYRRSDNVGLYKHLHKLAMIHSSTYLSFKGRISNVECINQMTDAFGIERLPENERSTSILLAQASKNILAGVGKEIFKSTLFKLPENIQKVKELVDFEETTWRKYVPDEEFHVERLPHTDVLRKMCGQIFEPQFPGIPEEVKPSAWKATMRGLICFDVKKVFIKDNKRNEILQLSKLSKSLASIIKNLNTIENKLEEWQNLKPGSSKITSLNYLFFP